MESTEARCRRRAPTSCCNLRRCDADRFVDDDILGRFKRLQGDSKWVLLGVATTTSLMDGSAEQLFDGAIGRDVRDSARRPGRWCARRPRPAPALRPTRSAAHEKRALPCQNPPAQRGSFVRSDRRDMSVAVHVVSLRVYTAFRPAGRAAARLSRFMVTTMSEMRMVASSRIGKRPPSVAAPICAPRPMVCSVRSVHVRVFGEDRGVPRAAGGGDHAGDEIGEDAGQDQAWSSAASG